jgi:YD repeat-containing protein
VLLLEEGKEERFLKTSTGAYVSLYHSNGILLETETGYRYETNGKTMYHFDHEGYYLSQELEDGTKTILHYEAVDNKRRLVKVARETGEAFLLTYTEKGSLTKVSDHTGRSVTYQMSDNRLAEVCTPMGHPYRYGYSPSGKLEWVENPRGIRTVENEYDDQQRTTHQVFPDGTTMSYSYNDETRSVTMTERNDSRITYVHDEKYRDIKHIYRDGEERFEYNQLNQKTLVVDKAGNKTQYGYDEKGNLTRVINALGAKIELAYNEQDQPTYIGINGTTKVRNHYDDKGNLTESIDALGNTFRFEYEGKRPLKIHQADGSTLQITYDERGNITQLQDASGSVSKFTYDSLNRVSQTVDGNGNKTQYSYDEEDNITSVTNAKGDTRYYEIGRAHV